MKLNPNLRLFLIRSASLGLLTSAASAAEIKKASIANTNALNTGAAWVGAAVPGASDVALWDNTVTATNVAGSETQTQLGGNLSWQGIKITDVLGTANQTSSGIRILNGSSANTLTLGPAGIDMSTATQALLIQSKITLADNQEWNVKNANTNGNPLGFNNGEDLGLWAQATNTAFNLGGYALTLKGAGQITIGSGYLISNGTINVQNNTKIQGSSSRVGTLSNTVAVNITAGGNLRLQANGSGASLSNAAAISVSGEGSTLDFGLSDGGSGSNVSSSGAISMATGTTLQITGGAGAFTQSGGVDFTGNVNWNYSGNVAHTNGAVVSGNLTGNGSVSFKNTNSSANGQVRLSGDNSGFTGTMTLNGASGQRALRLTSATAGSAAATWAVDANNILQVDGVSVQLGTLNGAGTVTNSHASTAATLNVGAGSFSGVISNGAAITSLVKNNTLGTLTLGGTNTYTGTTTVTDGTLAFAGGNGSTASTTGNTANSSVSIGASGTLQLQANGTNTASGVSTALTTTTNTSGLLLVGGSGATLQLRSDSAVTFASGTASAGIGFNTTTFNMDVNQLTNAGVAGPLAIFSNGLNYGVSTGNTVLNVTGGNGYSLALGTLNGGNHSTNSLTINPTSASVSIAGITTAQTTNATLPIVLSGTATGNTMGAIVQNGNANYSVTKSGISTWTLSGTSTYTGATNVNEGTLQVSGSIGASAVTVSGAGTVLATDAAASFGSTVAINNGAILAAGGAAAAGTATVTGETTFNNGSIFSWDINATGTSYDKLIAPSLAGEVTPGDAVFRIVAADASFAETFWDTTQTWTDIFTTNGSTPISSWAGLFTVTVVNSSFGSITPVGGSFALSGNTLTWSAVPEPNSALAGLLLTAGLLRRRRK